MTGSLLPLGLRVVGDVRGTDGLVISGEVDGEVRIEGPLVIESTGRVHGNVDALSILVRGTMVGDARATESIGVVAGGTLVGDMLAPRVEVARGARFRGHVRMSRDPFDPLRTLGGQASAPLVAATSAGLVGAPRETSAGELRAAREDTSAGELRAAPSDVASSPEAPPAVASAAQGEGSGPARRPPPARMPVIGRVAATRRGAPPSA